MPIEWLDGNLLESDCHVLIHQANCRGVMGAGIAAQIKQRWPSAYQADRDFHIPFGPDRLGHISHAIVRGLPDPLIIVNAYGQDRYGRGKQTNEMALELAIHEALVRTKKLEEHLGMELKVGLPAGIGAGLGGGDPVLIRQLLKRLATDHNRTLWLYDYRP